MSMWVYLLVQIYYNSNFHQLSIAAAALIRMKQPLLLEAFGLTELIRICDLENKHEEKHVRPQEHFYY